MSQCAKGANKMWPFFGGFVVPKGQEALFIAVPDTYILLEAKMAKLSFNRRRAGYLVSNAAGGRWPSKGGRSRWLPESLQSWLLHSSPI
jgi:hypothetical protein